MSCRIVTLGVFLLSAACLAGETQPSGIWVDVPFVKQEKDGCVAASISMVMRYWNQDPSPMLSARADPRIIQRALYSGDAEGILASAMERYFQEEGFRTFVFRGEWTDLKHHLSLGRPLIVCLKESGSQRHCMVITGLDRQRRFVFVNDPARRKLLRLEWAEFEKSWNDAEKWTLLVVPKPGD